MRGILNSKAKTITFAAFLVAASTLISGLLGMLKMRLLAGSFDLSLLDSYFAAFRIPDLISATLITGGIIVSFLPLFSQYFYRNERDSWKLTNNLLNISFILFSFLCGLIWILAPRLIDIVVPGFSEAQKEMTVSLIRIMFVSPLIFAFSGIFSGVLQYFDKFLAYALAPVLYNVGIIFGITVLSKLPVFGSGKEIYGVAWGVVLGSFLHLLIQIPPAIKCGYRFRFIFDLKDRGLRRVFKLIIPRIISQASSQINLIMITLISSMLAVGSVAVFNFANNLYLFPVAIIGVSFAVAAFPSFSRSLANGDRRDFMDNFISTFRKIAFIIVPVSFMTFVLRAQIVRIILGTGKFGWEETRLTAASLGIFAFGMMFASLAPLIIRAFFSLQDTKTPAIISIITAALSIFLSFVFVFVIGEQSIFRAISATFLRLENISDFRVIWLAFAVSFSAAFQLILLLYFLKKRVPEISFKEARISFLKVLFGSVPMAATSYLSLKAVVLFVPLTTFWAVAIQAVVAFLAGATIYLVVLYLLNSRELGMFHDIIKKYFAKK